MQKPRVKVYKEVLKDVSAQHEGAKKFIEERVEGICDREKKYVVEVTYLFIYLCICLFNFVFIRFGIFSVCL